MNKTGCVFDGICFCITTFITRLLRFCLLLVCVIVLILFRYYKRYLEFVGVRGQLAS